MKDAKDITKVTVQGGKQARSQKSMNAEDAAELEK
jgi:hypothetical protein